MKLILINGPSGIGKSTIAAKLHEMIPLSLLLDIDAQRRYISGYKEHRKESSDLVVKLSLAMVENYLQNGYDVIIDKIFTDTQISDSFLELGKKYNATVFEFILTADKETLIARAHERGYREGSMLTPEKVPTFWDAMQMYLKERTLAEIIDTTSLHPEQTFELIKAVIK